LNQIVLGKSYLLRNYLKKTEDQVKVTYPYLFGITLHLVAKFTSFEDETL